MSDTLAAKIRSKYPGAYDDMDDGALESAITAKFPGVYDDIPKSTLPKRPVSAEDFMTPEDIAKRDGPTWSTSSMLSSLGHAFDPRPLIQGAVEAVRNPQPVDPRDAALGPLSVLAPLVRGVVGGQVAEGRKAIEDVKAGRYVEAGGRALAAAVPVLGPAAAAAGEQGARGDIGGMVGSGLGLVAPVAIGAVAPKSLGVRGMGAADADAIALAERAGVPLDAATATGNKFVKAAQHLSDRSLAGSLIADRAGKAQQAGLATLGEQLAAKAHGRAVTGAEAGTAAQRGVSGVVSEQRGLANDAYTRLRTLEEAPENLTTIAPEPVTINPQAPPFFSVKPKPTADELFADVLKDARDNGYTGKVGELRAKFDARTEQARGLKAATAEGDEYSHAALLKEIRSRGGLRPYDLDIKAGAPTGKLRGDHIAAQQANAKNYGKNAVYRNDGLATDDMLQQLSEDPKWGAVITPDTDLTDLVLSGAMKGPAKAVGNLEDHLRGVGVQPGATWWREGQAAQQVPMAVDLASVKDAVRPIMERLAKKKEITGALLGKEGDAAARLSAILEGPDVASLSAADAALSDLKRMARTNHPDLRNVGQGIAAKAVGDLHKVVMEAAERAGPEAVAALNEGRTATKAKYAAADVLKRLEGAQRTKSPTTAYRGLTSSGDISIGHLEDTIKQAPATKPLIARAVLDGLIEHPTAGAAKTWTDWQKIGPQTKALLYAPEHVKELDSFFKLRKMMAENPNPSGTAHTLLTAGQTGQLLLQPWLGIPTQIGAAALSTLLHSRAGVRLLTRGLRIPAKNKTAAAAWATDFAAATNPNGRQSRPAPVPAR